MKCLMFPGQGVQRRGMGEDLFIEFPGVVAEADRILGYSIEDICRHDERSLRSTQYAQPAIFMVNALLGMRALNRHRAKFDVFAGHSLGEYNALVMGGYLDLFDALAVVKRRAELMARITGGGMAAVIGPPWPLIRRACQEANLTQVYVANRNADDQTTIAGHRAHLSAAIRVLSQLPGTRVVPLNVSGPFHTPLMASVMKELAETLGTVKFRSGHTPVVSSVTATYFDDAKATELLSRQITSPVEWVDTVRTLRAEGAVSFDEANGRTLTALIGKIR